MYTLIRYDQEPALSPALLGTDIFCISRSPYGASAPFQKVQMSDILAYITSNIAVPTLYSANGTLAGARTVSLGTNSLTFSGNADINLLPNTSSSWVGLNIGVDSYAGVYDSYFGVSLKQSLNLVTSGLFTGNVFNGISMTCYNDDDIAPAILFNMSRGTSDTPTILQNGQVVGEIDFAAYTGDTVDGLPDFRASGFIYGVMEADASSGKAPMALYFDTGDINGNVQDRMYIANNGATVVSNDLNGIPPGIPTAFGTTRAQFTSLNTSQNINILAYDIEPVGMDKLSFAFARARGSSYSGLSAVGNADNIGVYTWLGYDGSRFIPSFGMGVTVDTVSTGIVNGHFNIIPQSNLTGLNIASTGIITLGLTSTSALVVTGTLQYTAPSFLGSTQFLGVNSAGDVIPMGATGTLNIYNSDGSLTANRTVTMGTESLTFTGTSNQLSFNNSNGSVELNNAMTLNGTNNFALFTAGGLINGNNNLLINTGGSAYQVPASNNFIWNSSGNSSGLFVNQGDCIILNSNDAQAVFSGNHSVIIGTPGGQVSGTYDVLINCSGSFTGDGSLGHNLLLNSNGVSLNNGSYSGIINSASSSITSSGSYNMILCGQGNTVSGTASNSVAFGNMANARHSNCFIWSDGFDNITTAANQFLIHASGGFCVGGINPLSGVDIQTSFGVGEAYPISTIGGSTSLNPNGVTFQMNGNSTLATIPMVLSGSTKKEGRQYWFVDVSGLAFGGGGFGVTFSTDDGSTINGSPTLRVTSLFFGCAAFQAINGNWYSLVLPPNFMP